MNTWDLWGPTLLCVAVVIVIGGVVIFFDRRTRKDKHAPRTTRRGW